MQLITMYLSLLAVVATTVYGQFTFYQPVTGQQPLPQQEYYPPHASAVPQQTFGWQRWDQNQQFQQPLNQPPQFQQQLNQQQLQQQQPQQQQFFQPQPQQQQQQLQLNNAPPQANQVFARPMMPFQQQQPQQPVPQQQPQFTQQFRQFPQFQPNQQMNQQFPVASMINNQFQPDIARQVPQAAPQQLTRDIPQPPVKINKEKYFHSETPKIFEQQFRIQTLTQNEILTQQAQQGEPRLPAQQRMLRVPPPPERFIPHLADIYGEPMPDRPYTPPNTTANSMTTKSLVEAYGPEEKLIDGRHPSYIEDTAKTAPADQIRRVIQPPRPPQSRRIKNKDISGAVVRRPSTGTRPAPRSRVVITPRPPPPLVQQPNPVSVAQRPVIIVPLKAIPKTKVPVNSDQKANDVFLSCCKSINVAKSCERICNFDVLNKKTLTGMFLGTDPCPQSYGLDLMQCAAQSDDHTECCIERGVHTTSAGRKCLGFCNMRPGNTFQADVSMLPCWGVLNDIKSCFRDHIQNS